jgi:glycosyltransferase involved in cell wall biosynthesis
MLLSNGFAPDPRVAAEALALKEAAHQVIIFAWDRTGELPTVEDYNGIQVVRCRIQSTYSKGPLQIFKFREFWQAARAFLREHPADIIHCHDLDTLQPGLSFGRKNNIPVIFDAHESYPDMVAHLFPSGLVFLIRSMEARLVPRTTAVITVGEVLACHYRKLQARQVVVVGNYKTLTLTKPVIPQAPPPLKIIYVGGLNRDRLIGPMIQAVAGDARYEFTIVGAGAELPHLHELAGSHANIIFTGFLPQQQARTLIDQCHLVYYGIDPTYPNNQYSTPNLLFLALASGRPIITTNVGEIAEIIRTQNCGTVFPDLETESIRQVLDGYFEQSLWQRQSEQSFQAATHKYNWDIAKQNLLKLYHIEAERQRKNIPKK